jgi:hypothetical protein
MSSKVPGPPRGQSWIWITRDILESSAWRSLSINARRFIDFLLIEHMKHGGRKNGQLLAPRRQLEEAGIGSHFVSPAIEETVSRGFVLVKRGRGRQPNIYAITWLPLFDGTVLHRPWSARPVKTAEEQSLQMTAEQQHHMLPNSSHCGRSDCQTAVTRAPNDCCFATVETAAPSKNHDLTTTGGSVLMSIPGDAASAGPAVKLNGATYPPPGKSRPARQTGAYHAGRCGMTRGTR